MNTKNSEQTVYETLDRLGISYQVFLHEAVHTVAEARIHCQHIPGTRFKSLFLKGNKMGEQHILVVMPGDSKVDIKRLGEEQGLGHLGMASPERLLKYLGLRPGSVSPFGLLHDTEGQVQVFIDASLLETRQIAFHPNVNTASVLLETKNFLRFLETLKNPVTFIQIPTNPAYPK